MQLSVQLRLYEAGCKILVLEGNCSVIEMAKLMVNLGMNASGFAFSNNAPVRWRRRKAA